MRRPNYHRDWREKMRRESRCTNCGGKRDEVGRVTCSVCRRLNKLSKARSAA
jgi:hypothetical protein